MKKTLRGLVSCSGAIVILMALAANAIAVEPTLSRQDHQGPVTVTTTLIPSVTADGPLRVNVALESTSYGYGGDVYRVYAASTLMFVPRLQADHAAEPRWSER